MVRTDLGRRLAVAALGVPVGVGVAWAGGWVATAVLATIASLGVLEVFRLGRSRGARPFAPIGVAGAALLVVLAGLSGATLEGWAPWAIGLLMTVLLLSLGGAVFLRQGGERPLQDVAITLLGILYTGGTLAFGLLLRGHPQGGGWAWGGAGMAIMVLPILVTWMGDSAAYFAGHRWGRRKLLPAVSPGKTIEGGVGGLFGAAASAALFSILFLQDLPGGMALHPLGAALLGVLIGGVAQLADLAESLLKREAGVKDSGALLPGHGGVLDRFDAIFFTLPLTYALLPLFLR